MDRVYNALPPESRVASVQMMVPEHVPPNPSCVLFLAATGDQGYARRLNLGSGLLKEVRLVDRRPGGAWWQYRPRARPGLTSRQTPRVIDACLGVKPGRALSLYCLSTTHPPN